MQKAQEQHINEVMSHRTLCTRLGMLSEEATQQQGVSDFNGVLKIDLDGADQGKTLLPRGLDNNKFFSGLWRPQLHVMGALIHGVTCHSKPCCGSCAFCSHIAEPHQQPLLLQVAEVYYLMAPDCPKDSSSEMTILYNALHAAEEILKGRDICMPPCLALEAWLGLSHDITWMCDHVDFLSML